MTQTDDARAAETSQETGLYDKRWKALIVVLTAVFVDLVDISIVNVAIPEVQRDIGASFAAIQWVLAGYSLAFALVLITGGRLGDIYGRKRMFITGMIVFTLASGLCGVSQGPGMLIGGRVLQGVGAGLMMPQVLSMIQVLFPGAERAKAFGAYGAVAGLATVSGPLAGALLTNWDVFGLDWRPIFLVNLLVGAFAITAAIRWLPESKAPHALKLDFVGIALISVALLGVFFPLIQGRELDWPYWTWVMMAVALCFFVAFAFHQRRASERDGSPLVEPRLFTEKSFIAGTLITALLLATVGSYFLIYTVSLQIGLGFSILETGLTGLPFSIGSAIGSGIGAKLAPVIGRRLLATGVFFMGVGMVALAWTVGEYEGSVHVWQLYPPLLLSGLGMGFIIVPLSDFALARVRARDAGSASGVVATSQQLGSALGVAVIGVLFFGVVAGHATTSAQAASPALRGSLVSAGEQIPVVNGISNGFEQCFVDRSKEKDPNRVPVSCQSPGLSASTDQPLAVAAAKANSTNFAHAWQVCLLWLAALQVIVFGLVFLLPGKVEHREPAA